MIFLFPNKHSLFDVQAFRFYATLSGASFSRTRYSGITSLWNTSSNVSARRITDIYFTGNKPVQRPANNAHIPGKGLHLLLPVSCGSIMPAVMLVKPDQGHIGHFHNTAADRNDILQGQAAFINHGGNVGGNKTAG
jgi:hypothetical protein